MSEREPRPQNNNGNQEPEEKVEHSQDPKEIVELYRQYHHLRMEYAPLAKKEHELLLPAPDYVYTGEEGSTLRKAMEEAQKVLDKILEIQKKVSLDLNGLDELLTKEPPERIFKLWVVKPRVDEQLREARSLHAPKKYANIELKEQVIEEYLRQQGLKVDEGLQEYNWRPSLVAARDNLGKIYGDEAEEASDYVLVSHEILESN